MFKDLNPIFLSQLRLAIMSHLVVVRQTDFNTLKEQTGATSGNLSVQIGRLQEAGYLEVEKTYRKNYPLTLCRITDAGLEAFEQFYSDLRTYF